MAVRGSVVDVEFPGDLPAVNNRLEAGAEGASVLEVASHVDARTVRTIALTPTRGLARGDAVRDTGRTLDVPVGRELLGRMLNIFGDVISSTASWWWRLGRSRPVFSTSPRTRRRASPSSTWKRGATSWSFTTI